MTVISEICQHEQVSLQRGVPQELVAACQVLQDQGIPAFVTRYNASNGDEPGIVVVVNDKFLEVCKAKSAKFLGRTYRQIHDKPAVANQFTADERVVMSSPNHFSRMDEGNTVDVVKIALPGATFQSSPEASSFTFVLGFFLTLEGETRGETLDPRLVAAQEPVRNAIYRESQIS